MGQESRRAGQLLSSVWYWQKSSAFSWQIVWPRRSKTTSLSCLGPCQHGWKAGLSWDSIRAFTGSLFRGTGLGKLEFLHGEWLRAPRESVLRDKMWKRSWKAWTQQLDECHFCQILLVKAFTKTSPVSRGVEGIRIYFSMRRVAKVFWPSFHLLHLY